MQVKPHYPFTTAEKLRRRGQWPGSSIVFNDGCGNWQLYCCRKYATGPADTPFRYTPKEYEMLYVGVSCRVRGEIGYIYIRRVAIGQG